MVIEVGETVVYPHHGAATITKMTTRTIKGVDTKYVKLKMHEGDLVVELPISNLEEVGVRDVIGLSDVEAVYNVLRSRHRRRAGQLVQALQGEHREDGQRRRAAHQRGRPRPWRRDKERGVSAGEKAMLAKARRNLISELLLALHLTAEETEVVLDEVLELRSSHRVSPVNVAKPRQLQRGLSSERFSASVSKPRPMAATNRPPRQRVE